MFPNNIVSMAIHVIDHFVDIVVHYIISEIAIGQITVNYSKF